MKEAHKSWHLSAEARWILVDLRDAIQHNLVLDELGNSADFTGHWHLFPLIFKAFTKIWCHRIPFCVQKSSFTPCHCMDVPKTLVDVVTYEKFRSAYNCELNRERDCFSSDDLPF